MLQQQVLVDRLGSQQVRGQAKNKSLHIKFWRTSWRRRRRHLSLTLLSHEWGIMIKWSLVCESEEGRTINDNNFFLSWNYRYMFWLSNFKRFFVSLFQIMDFTASTFCFHKKQLDRQQSPATPMRQFLHRFWEDDGWWERGNLFIITENKKDFNFQLLR